MISTPPAAPPAPVEHHDALPPGTRLGELEILRVLGVGGFGIVYLAQDHALERHVALKEYMPSALAGRGKGQAVSIRSGAHTETYAIGLRSFVNEARLLARFNHPSLVKVYRFWEENGTAYMVMPYLQGRTLRDARLAMQAPPGEARLRSVIMPLLDALEVLHREGVYHRDIAPDNVLLPPGEPPVLLDFGAARRAIGDRTQTFTAILKPSYAPIEQYAESAQLRQGPWTDLYALGAVVYYLLRGTPPPPATARAVQDDEAPLLLAHEHPGLSAHFLAAMEWALAVRPAERPPHIAALREVLDGRAAVPPRAPRTGTTLIHRSIVLPPPAVDAFAPTVPSDLPGSIEPTQPMTTRPHTVSSGVPRSQPGPARTLPDTTVMPATPTMAPVDARGGSRRAVRIAAGLLGIVAIAAGAWVLGHRSATPDHAAALPGGAKSVPMIEAGAASSTTALTVEAPASAASEATRAHARTRTARSWDSATAPASREPNRAAAALEPRSPREACGSRVFLALAVCMEEQCDKPQYRSHPQCEKVRAIVERRRRNDSGD